MDWTIYLLSVVDEVCDGITWVSLILFAGLLYVTVMRCLNLGDDRKSSNTRTAYLRKQTLVLIIIAIMPLLTCFIPWRQSLDEVCFGITWMSIILFAGLLFMAMMRYHYMGDGRKSSNTRTAYIRKQALVLIIVAIVPLLTCFVP